jgi:tetratricopeptide (TPR) repeat protein
MGIDLFRKFLDEKETTPAVYFQAARTFNLMAGLFCEQGDFAKATQTEAQSVAILERLVSEFPNERAYCRRLAIARFSLGYKLCLAKRDDEAGEQFARAQEYHLAAVKAPGTADTFYDYATYLLICPHPKYHDLAQAAEYAQRAIALEPGNGEYWSTLGWAELRREHWKPAQAALEEALSHKTDSVARDRLGLAIALWRQGNRESAKALYDQAVKELERNGEAAAAAQGAYRDATALIKGTNPVSVDKTKHDK